MDEHELRLLEASPEKVATLNWRLADLNARLTTTFGEGSIAGKGDDMNPKKPEGQYRTTPDGDHRPMAYVWGGGTPSYVTEAAYRAKGYSPAFEMLPTENEYDAAQS